jgi:hypothetical protein
MRIQLTFDGDSIVNASSKDSRRIYQIAASSGADQRENINRVSITPKK